MTTFITINDSEIDVGSGVVDTVPRRMADNITAIMEQDASAPTQYVKYGHDIAYTGEDSVEDIDFGMGGGTVVYGSIVECRTFSLHSSVLLYPVSPFLIIRATESITIEGEINISAKAGGNPWYKLYPQNYQHLKLGASEGGDDATGFDGVSTLGLAGGAKATGPGLDGSDGQDRSGSPAAFVGREAISSMFHNRMYTSNGGGNVSLIAPTINITGTIDVSGFPGTSTTGGSGGGVIMLTYSDNGLSTFTGTLDVSGGAKATSPSGGKGGDGTVVHIARKFY